MTTHQQKQIEVINKIEEQIKNNTLNFSTVEPVDNYEDDPRLCLTSVHFPHQDLLTHVQKIISELSSISSNHYYYPQDCLHMTIKNIKIIQDPPSFSQEDIKKVKGVFDQTIPKYKKFQVYFYRLLVFPVNLALIGTADEELTEIFLDLDKKLKDVNVPDDKKYLNNQYFFSNMTLCRFMNPLTEELKNKINELSQSMNIPAYTVNSVTLLSCNAALKKRKIIGKWDLK